MIDGVIVLNKVVETVQKYNVGGIIFYAFFLLTIICLLLLVILNSNREFEKQLNLVLLITLGCIVIIAIFGKSLTNKVEVESGRILYEVIVDEYVNFKEFD